SKNLLRDIPVNKIKEFERDFIEFLNAKHRDTLDTLKDGKLTDQVIDVLTSVTKDLSAKYKN
ncbi:MAG: F0F1 ATP synthase subunit alpha, partial [Flavobacteriaceae bacterium]|nr:F0F1 ATP synthase subunit alpha [Flavobacteriaceae bacterium]